MFKITISGSQQTLKKLSGIKKRLLNYGEYFENFVTPAIFHRFDEIFKKQGAVSNFSRWRRLRAATLAEKKAKGLRLEILRRTDRLYTAYTTKGRDNRRSIGKNRFTYKNIVPYGIFHETGTARGLPKRTVIARLLAYKEFKNDLETGLSHYLFGKDRGGL